MVKHAGVCLVIVLSLSFLIGCSSGFKTIAPKAPDNYEKLGQAEGTGSGMLGIISTAYNFIPMGLNERVGWAYEDALKKVPGATALTNVTFQEDWYWLVVGTLRVVTIKGDAIRETKQITATKGDSVKDAKQVDPIKEIKGQEKPAELKKEGKQ